MAELLIKLGQLECACQGCGELFPLDQLCQDLVCAGCHKTEPIEDCRNDVQVNAIRAKAGLPPVKR